MATPAKKIRAEIRFQTLRRPRRHDPGGEPLRIHLILAWRPDQIAAYQSQLGEILRLIPRVAAEVLVRSKLRRIDEDRDHAALGPAMSEPNQLQMAFVQGAHGGHKGHRFARSAPAGNLQPQLAHGTDNFNPSHLMRLSQ